MRAVELLRASFLELAITSRPGARRRRGAPAHRAGRHALRDRAAGGRAGLDVGGRGGRRRDGRGAGRLGRHDDAGRVPAGRARASARSATRLCARVTFAGLGTQAHVDMPGGYADVSQTIVLVEALVRFRRGRRLEPVISIGAGILRVSAEGHETAPYIGGNAWPRCRPPPTPASALRMPLRPRRVELGVEIHALVAEPYPVVRFFQTEVARAGRPSLLGVRDAAGRYLMRARAFAFASLRWVSGAGCNSAPLDVATIAPRQPGERPGRALDVRRRRRRHRARQLGQRPRRQHLRPRLELDDGQFTGALQLSGRDQVTVRAAASGFRPPPRTTPSSAWLYVAATDAGAARRGGAQQRDPVGRRPAGRLVAVAGRARRRATGRTARYRFTLLVRAATRHLRRGRRATASRSTPGRISPP